MSGDVDLSSDPRQWTRDQFLAFFDEPRSAVIPPTDYIPPDFLIRVGDDETGLGFYIKTPADLKGLTAHITGLINCYWMKANIAALEAEEKRFSEVNAAFRDYLETKDFPA